MTELTLFSENFDEDAFEVSAGTNGFTYWYASDLMSLVGYESMESFRKAVNKAISALNSLNFDIAGNIDQLTRDVDGRQFKDYKLSRLGCYLTVMNADPKKKKVAAAQVYFAKLAGALADYQHHLEGVERVLVRDELSDKEKSLAGVAKAAGVENYAFFQNAGYRGMYNKSINELRKIRGVPENRSPLDFMGKTELAANLFRTTQTELKIQTDSITGQKQLEQTALKVGQQVRQSMIEISGVAPEKLPSNDDIKDVKKELKSTAREIKKIDKKSSR